MSDGVVDLKFESPRTMARAPTGNTDAKGEFPLALTPYVFHLFAVVSRHREARIDQLLQPLGLNVSRHRALSVIASLAPCTMSELAEFSAVDRTTMTRVVDQLVEAGLVERTTPREDRRQVVLTLTDNGRSKCTASLKVVYRLSRHLLDGLPEETQRVVAHAFETILGNLIDDQRRLGRLLLRRVDDAV